MTFISFFNTKTLLLEKQGGNISKYGAGRSVAGGGGGHREGNSP